MLKIGSHVGMSGKTMFLGSVKEALSYDANTFMVYTGAPQNTRRKDLKDLNIEAATQCMKENGINEFVVHAPYIINLGNTVKPETYEIAVEFLGLELQRTMAMGSKVLVLHPGAHVGAGVEAGVASIVKGINEVLTADTDCYIALETMAGKGSEVGGKFEELKMVLDAVGSSNVGVCLDTCHVYDGGYDIAGDLDGVLAEFDRVVGLDRLWALHLNDSKNPFASHKDRHECLGQGSLGVETFRSVVSHPLLKGKPMILETPNELPGYAREIALLRSLET